MTDRLAEYRAFIADKAIKERMGGFTARPINAQAKIAGKNLHSAEMSAMDILGGVPS